MIRARALKTMLIITTLSMAEASADNARTDHASNENVQRFRGDAFDSNNQLIYREYHEVTGECRDDRWHPLGQTVRYTGPDGESTFASKDATYPGALTLPEVEFRQPRFDEVLRLLPDSGNSLEIRWRADGNDTRVWRIDPPEDLVADLGFDHFIRESWSGLTGGDAVRFRFLAPTRGEHYGFLAEPAENPAIEADHVFRVRPSGVMLRLLVEPIYLGYDNTGRLTHYTGLGNIRENADQNYTVSIRYEYQQMPGCSLLPDA